MSRVEWTPGWEDELRRRAADVATNAADQALSDVSVSHSGRPVDEVRDALAASWANATGGGSITDPELTLVAEAISGGGRASISGGRLVVYGPGE